MIRPFRKYDISQIGYYLSILTESGNNVNRAVTLIDGVNDSRYAGCSFVNEDWFEYIATLGKNKELYLDDGHLRQCQKANSALDDNIMKRHGYRYMLPDDYEIFNEHLGNEDLIDMLNSLYSQYLIELFEEYNESFKRIYDVILQEYEPLYNLDVTYEEQHTGTDTTVNEGCRTDTTTYSGSEKDEHRGSDTLTKSGSETDARTGTETTTFSGSETDARTGTDTLTKSGSEAKGSTGHDDFEDQSGAHTETTTTTYAFDSVNGVPEATSRTDNGRNERTTYGRTDTTTFTDRKDETEYNSSNTKSFTDREDEIEYNTSDTKSFTDREDEIEYNTSDTKSFTDRQDATTYNSSNTKTFTNRQDALQNYHADSGSVTHGEKIVTKRYGNQGVTRSDELASAEITFRDKLSFLNMVADRVAQRISIL